MNYVAVCGLISAIVSEKFGIPFDEKYVMLLDEVTKSSKHLTDSLRRIEEKLDAIIIGDINAGHIALGNVISNEFSTDERLVQVSRARDFFEQGYARLQRVSEFSLTKPEIASYIALCYFLLGKTSKSVEWFKNAHEDYELAGKKSRDVIDFESEFENTPKVAGVPVVGGIVWALLCIPGPPQVVGGAFGVFRMYRHDKLRKSKNQWLELISEINPKRNEISKIISILNDI